VRQRRQGALDSSVTVLRMEDSETLAVRGVGRAVNFIVALPMNWVGVGRRMTLRRWIGIRIGLVPRSKFNDSRGFAWTKALISSIT
jgi:hypothetical protein